VIKITPIERINRFNDIIGLATLPSTEGVGGVEPHNWQAPKESIAIPRFPLFIS